MTVIASRRAAQWKPAVPLRPVEGPAAWYGPDLAGSDAWLHRLTAAEIAELDAASVRVRNRGLGIIDIAQDDFPLPGLGPVLEDIEDEVINGRGFALIRGLPVDRYPTEDAAIAYWGMGTYLGRAVSQNPQGHVLGHVKDIGVDADDPNKRGYQSRDDLPFHTDIGADMVVLLCLRPAKSGGQSRLVSAITVHNEMLKRRPDLVAELAKPIHRDRRGEVPEGKDPHYLMPVFNYYEGYLTISYVRRFIESARRFEDVPALTPAQIEALDLLDALAYSDELRLDMDFLPGDIQVVNNETMLHTRTEYQDHPEPERKRHLFRLWLAANNGWPLPPAYYERWGSSADMGRPIGIDMPGVEHSAPLDAE